MREEEKIALPETQTQNTSNTQTGSTTHKAETLDTLKMARILPLDETGHQNLSILAIARGLTVIKIEEWPSKALDSARERYKRLPRNTFDTLCIVYNEKFGLQQTVKAFKNIAEKNSKKRKKSNVNKISCEKKPKLECTTTDSPDMQLDDQTKSIFKQQLKIIKNQNMLLRRRTHKIPVQKVNNRCLDSLNKSIKHHINTNKPTNYQQISDILYAAQLTYQEINNKQRIKSKWKENIMQIVDKNRMIMLKHKRYKEIVQNKGKYIKNMNKEISKISRKENTQKWDVNNIDVLINKYNEKTTIYT